MLTLDLDPNIFNDAYIPLLTDHNRYNFIYGGAGSGKSDFAHLRELIKSFSTVKTKTLNLRKFKTDHKNSTHSKYQTLCDRYGLSKFFDFGISPLKVVNKKSRAEFIFLGMDDPEKIKSIDNVQRVIMEELSQLSLQEYLQTVLRVRGLPNTQFTGIFNPVSAQHWIKTEIVDKPKPNTTILKTTYKDNKFLLPEDIEAIESLKDLDENYYNIYALGDWGDLSKAIIYNNWKVAEGEFPRGQYLGGYGLDFGFSSSEMAMCECEMDTDARQLHTQEMIYEKGMTVSDLINRMESLGVDKDKIIWADAARADSIEEISRAGYNIKPADKSVKDGIDSVRSFKILTYESPNMNKEFSKYKYIEKSNGDITETPLKVWDHLMDALRYFTHSTANSLGSDWSNAIDDIVNLYKNLKPKTN